MTKVLLCDMNSERYEKDTSIFIDIAKKLVDWDFLFIHNINYYLDRPDIWLEDIRIKIAECEIIVSFNGMDFLKRIGNFRPEFQSLILDKIRGGTPILSKLIEHSRYNHFSEDVMQPICKQLGASALYYRVYSDVYTLEKDPNPYSTIYQKANDALRDPQLFSGVSEVYSDSAAIINYEPDYFPLIEINPQNYKLVDEGDLFFSGSLGMKNTIAVRADLFDSLQIFYTGRMFENPYTDSIGREYFGITKNKRLAENIIKCLDNSVDKPAHHINTCYELFNKLERGLGMLIEQKLTSQQIKTWLEQNAVENKYTKLNLGQVNFVELVKLICSHWQSFAKDIQLEKEELRFKCLKINKKERRYLAHPIKAEAEGYVFSESSTILIKQVLRALH